MEKVLKCLTQLRLPRSSSCGLGELLPDALSELREPIKLVV